MTTSNKGTRVVPSPVRLAMTAWLTAIAAGVGEALVRLTFPDPPTAGELAIRFAIYAGLALSVAALRTGHDVVRWALTVLLGGVGLLSLLAEPAGWLLAGGSVTSFLAAADTQTLMVVLLRGVHIGAVLVALAAMYRPAANAFFRPHATPDSGSASG